LSSPSNWLKYLAASSDSGSETLRTHQVRSYVAQREGRVQHVVRKSFGGDNEKGFYYSPTTTSFPRFFDKLDMFSIAQ